MATNQHILSISLATQVLQPGSVERVRAEAYASAVEKLTMIVVTRDQSVALQPQEIGNLTIIPVRAHSKLLLFLNVYRTGVKYIQNNPAPNWQTTAQDAFDTGLLAYLIARRCSTQFHLQVHGDPFGNPLWRKESVLNLLRLWIGKRLLMRACRVRVVSKRTATSVQALGVPAHKLAVLPIQPNVARFLAVGEQRQFLQKDTFTFVYVGRLAPEKNLKRLLTTFIAAHVQQPQLRLKIVGSGPLEKTLRQLAAASIAAKAITFTAWSDDIPTVLAAADALVLTSKHEGYALVLIEAMAAGIPVVTTDVGCVGEVCHAGEHGIVVSQTNDAELVQALLTLGTHPEQAVTYGRAAHRAIAQSIVSHEQYVRQWTETFCAN